MTRQTTVHVDKEKACVPTLAHARAAGLKGIPDTVDPRALRAAACELVGQKAWAAAHHVSAHYVCDVLKGRREPGEAICAVLGIERSVTYRRKP